MSQIAERMYYDEPQTLEFSAKVTAIRELARVDGAQVWQIALDRSAFYPTSGGQPHDTGVLVATARSGALLEVPILSVEEDIEGEVWHTTSKPLQEGTAVRGRVQAGRRRDHMQQHSGQHLLSAVLERAFQAHTISFHLGETESTIDLQTAGLERDELETVERTANEVIRAALPLGTRYVSRDEAEAMKQAGTLRKLPDRTGAIRVVEIPGWDVNACGGTHVATTAEIGPMLLRGTEMVRGALRLSFLCGERAIRAARADYRRLQDVAQLLTTSVDAVSTSIERLKADHKDATKTIAGLLQESARYHAAELAAEAKGEVIHTLPAGRDAAYAKLLAAAIVRDTAAGAALIATADDTRSTVVLAAKAGVLDCGAVLRTVLAEHGLRGGGSEGMAQGAVEAGVRQAVMDGVRDRLRTL